MSAPPDSGAGEITSLLPRPSMIPSTKSLRGIYWRPAVICTLIYFFMGVGYFASAAAQLRLLESIICRTHYQENDPSVIPPTDEISERLCKVPAIQGSLAELLGWQSFFDNIPGLLLALPYGIWADKYGRKPVLILSFLGQALGMAWVMLICWTGAPIYLMWFSSIFLLMGGGSNVASAVTMMVMTDSTSEALRSMLFMYFQAAVIVAELLSPPLGYLLMERNVWIPLFLNLCCGGATTALCCLLPSRDMTARWKAAQYSEISNCNDGESDEGDNTEDAPQTKQQPGSSHTANIRSLLVHLRQSIRTIIFNRNMVFLVATFLLSTFARDSMAFILQYVTNRYSWSIARASYLLSFRAVAQLVLFTVVLPYADSKASQLLNLSPTQKDLRLTRFSIVAITVGFLVIAMAPLPGFAMFGIAIYTMGAGLNTFARSLLSTLVDQAMLGTLYSTMSVMDTLGSLLAGPSMSFAFKIGTNLGGGWLGLPYLISTLLGALVTYFTFLVRLPKVLGNVSE